MASPATTQAQTTTTLTNFGQERVVDIPGSPLRIRYDEGVPIDLIDQIVSLLPVPREEFGDSGTVTVFVHSSVSEDLIDAYLRHSPRTTRDSARSILENFPGTVTSKAIWYNSRTIFQPGRPPLLASLLHEYFHTLQLEAGIFVPMWFTEGSANYMMFPIAARRGLISLERFEQFQLAEVKKVTLSIRELERGGPNQAHYYVGYFATKYLAREYGLESVRRDMWQNLKTLKDWPGAFAKTFGVSVEQFYSDFEQYRATL